MDTKGVRVRKIFAFILVLSATAGCANLRTQKNNDSDQAISKVKEVESFRVSDPEAPELVDQELEVIPDDINPQVMKWLAYFQGKGRPHMERYLARSTRYMTLMKRILRQNGLPEDLIYIALIESGFSSKATSKAAAVGYWQFIKWTGKRYGLEINSLVDERRDPVLSTQAAAEYFKGLYSMFGSWYLAMASYNVGENRVKKEVAKHFTRDFWELARRRRLPRETVNYVPKFIAAKLIAKNPAKYGFTDIEYEKPIEFELVKSDKPLNLRLLSEKMGIEYEEFKRLNPKFRGEIAPLKTTNNLELRVPVGQIQLAMNSMSSAIVEKVELIADAGDTQLYRIRSGDSLYSVARKYRTTVAWLRDVNDIKPGRKLRIGMRIQVPDRGASRKQKQIIVAKKEKSTQVDQEKAASNPEVVKNGIVYYIVQPGDTLSSIADEYDSSIPELRKMNRLSKRSLLKVGTRLKVPKDEGLPQNLDESSAQSNQVASKENSNSAQPNADKSSDQHVVKNGENLVFIAKKYGVTVDALRKANNLQRKSILRVGARLKIPSDDVEQVISPSNTDSANRKPAAVSRTARIERVERTEKKSKSSRRSAVNRQVASQKLKHKVHIVKSGENLTVIAARYRVSLAQIKQKNQIKNLSHLVVGARLLIPIARAN